MLQQLAAATKAREAMLATLSPRKLHTPVYCVGACAGNAVAARVRRARTKCAHLPGGRLGDSMAIESAVTKSRRSVCAFT